MSHQKTNIKMYEDVLKEMQHTKDVAFICSDEAFKYYEAIIGDVVVLYRMNAFRPDGRRLYYLNNALAKLFGCGDIASMMFLYPKIRYWRRFISVQSLTMYVSNGGDFIQDDDK